MSKYRARPKKIKQEKSYSCWAACLEAWSRSTSSISLLKEKDLYTTYGLASNGGLSNTGLSNLTSYLNGLGIRRDLLNQSNLTPDEYEAYLSSNYAILMYQTSPGSSDWHALLVYGVDNFLCYMDPRYGEYKKRGVYSVTSPNGFYVFYKP